MTVALNPRAGRLPEELRGVPVSPRPIDFHRRLPGYRPTPLIDGPAVAARLGLGRVLLKHEADRFGLPAFKVLGASWATWRLVCQRLGRSDDPADIDDIEDLRRVAKPLSPLGLVTATDGNHGRGVARTAAWFGFDARVLVPAGTVAARIHAIRSEGAEVVIVDGDYDECVTRAAALADDRHIVVSDTSWDGYTEIPADIVDGYGTMFDELEDQLASLHIQQVDAVVIPMGVGALGAAAVRRWPDGDTLRVTAEPVGADCLSASVLAGTRTTTPGPHHSMMVGMNCGTVSPIAWPALSAGVDVCVTVPDDCAAVAVRLLADAGIVSGETGAGTVAALIEMEQTGAFDTVGLGPESVVVCLVTEGATDPANYEKIVGRAPSAVAPGAW